MRFALHFEYALTIYYNKPVVQVMRIPCSRLTPSVLGCHAVDRSGVGCGCIYVESRKNIIYVQ